MAEKGPRIESNYFKKPHPFRRLKIVLSIGAAVVAGAWLLGAAVVGNKGIYNPGPVSNPHALVENKCVACHEGAQGAIFSRTVADHACQTCHQGPIHHPNQIFDGQNGAQPTCASCHQEHKGRTATVALVRDNKCAQCHGTLPQMTAATPASTDAKRPKTGFAAMVTSFTGDHPEFRVMAEHQKDNTAIKLNHKKHLRPDLPGPGGKKVQMQCTDCHRIKENGTTMAPVEFERDCQSCHPLAFDERIKEEAPHEEPRIVEAFIRTAFSVYAGSNPNEWKKNVDWHPARNLSLLKQMVDEAPRNLPEWLERQVTASRKLTFEKKCQECHTIQNPEALIPTVVKPEIPALWLSHARFSHAPHRMLQCASCHKDVPNSSLTSDVLLPSKADCTQCHNSSAAPNTCVTCHTYHDKSKPMPYPGSLTPAQLKTD